MGTFSRLTLALLMGALPTMIMACGDDSEDATGGEAGSGQADDDAGDDDAGGDNAGDDNAGDDDDTGAGGGSGGTAEPCDLSREGRAEAVIDSDIEESMQLDASKYYTIEGIVHVLEGATLTIPACTRVEGDGSSLGTLVVSRGARIVAEGTADAPILFTSPNTATDAVEPEPGDWGGVVILGMAPNSIGPDVLVEGLADDPLNQHGSDDPDPADDSGVLKYVKIEYSGIDLGDGNEINGLSLGSIGAGTTLSHVMIANSLDDCFEWFGGTVNADHLICENPGDDMFDVDDGYQGELSYLFGRHGAGLSSDPNGFEWDGTTDNAGSIDTVAEVSKATLCSGDTAQRGMVLRRGIQGSIDNAVLVGFPVGVDVRDEFEDGSDTAGDVTIENSTIIADAMADDESTDPANDDDAGFDDAGWFEAGNGNSTDNPGFTAGDCMGEEGPNGAVTGSELGAFADDATWVYGTWTGWN